MGVFEREAETTVLFSVFVWRSFPFVFRSDRPRATDTDRPAEEERSGVRELEAALASLDWDLGLECGEGREDLGEEEVDLREGDGVADEEDCLGVDLGIALIAIDFAGLEEMVALHEAEEAGFEEAGFEDALGEEARMDVVDGWTRRVLDFEDGRIGRVSLMEEEEDDEILDIRIVEESWDVDLERVCVLDRLGV